MQKKNSLLHFKTERQRWNRDKIHGTDAARTKKSVPVGQRPSPGGAVTQRRELGSDFQREQQVQALFQVSPGLLSPHRLSQRPAQGSWSRPGQVTVPISSAQRVCSGQGGGLANCPC